jgi:hypothetical protein
MAAQSSLNDQFRINFFSGYLDELCKAVKWVPVQPAFGRQRAFGAPAPACAWLAARAGRLPQQRGAQPASPVPPLPLPCPQD